jgi:hypothetical protein
LTQKAAVPFAAAFFTQERRENNADSSRKTVSYRNSARHIGFGSLVFSGSDRENGFVDELIACVTRVDPALPADRAKRSSFFKSRYCVDDVDTDLYDDVRNRVRFMVSFSSGLQYSEGDH